MSDALAERTADDLPADSALTTAPNGSTDPLSPYDEDSPASAPNAANSPSSPTALRQGTDHGGR